MLLILEMKRLQQRSSDEPLNEILLGVAQKDQELQGKLTPEKEDLIAQ